MATNQRMTGPQEARKEGFFPRSVRERVAYQHLDSGLLASRTRREHSSAAFNPPVCGGPRKLTQVDQEVC